MTVKATGRIRQDWILGFDIGGTKTVVLAGTAAGDVLDRRVMSSRATPGVEPMWTAMTVLADGLIAEHGPPLAIGVSVAGPVDSQRGIVKSPPNLPGWVAVPIKDRLVERFGVPTYVEHDAKAGALAEWLFGAARGHRNVIFLTYGTGLGAGLIFDGHLFRGSTENAGEVGHWGMARRGPTAYHKAGSWEALSSGIGLPLLARYLDPGHDWPDGMTAEDLIVRARAGDRTARRVITTSATWLGRGIANLIDLLDPEIVVLGSLAVRAGDLVLPTVRRIVERESLAGSGHPPVVASGLGDRIGDIAALSAAIYQGGMRPDVS